MSGNARRYSFVPPVPPFHALSYLPADLTDPDLLEVPPCRFRVPDVRKSRDVEPEGAELPLPRKGHRPDGRIRLEIAKAVFQFVDRRLIKRVDLSSAKNDCRHPPFDAYAHVSHAS